MDDDIVANLFSLDIGPLGSPPEGSKGGGQQTAKRAAEILLARDQGFYLPSRVERRALLVAFAQRGKVLYGAAFDIVRCDKLIDFRSADEIARNLDDLLIYEIKSTNRPGIDETLKDYFFNLSTAELLVAQSLGDRFRFAFVNIVTGTYSEMALRDVFARARGIYPTWSIKF